MKVKLYRIVVTPVEVELPGACSYCGQEVDPEDNVPLSGYDLSTRSLSGGTVTDDGVIDWTDGNNDYEPSFVYAVVCGNCDTTLVDLLHVTQ